MRPRTVQLSALRGVQLQPRGRDRGLLREGRVRLGPRGVTLYLQAQCHGKNLRHLQAPVLEPARMESRYLSPSEKAFIGNLLFQAVTVIFNS